MHRPSSQNTASLIAPIARTSSKSGNQTAWRWSSAQGLCNGGAMRKLPAGCSIAASRSPGVQRVSHDIPSIPPTDAIPSLRFP